MCPGARFYLKEKCKRTVAKHGPKGQLSQPRKTDPSISTPIRVFGQEIQHKSVNFSSIQTMRHTLKIYRPIRILITKFEAFHSEIVKKDIAELLAKF
jgi:hypothetical protein